ncbi:MAG: hypothetical protein EOO78_37220, partial [Oxalobacteraceae bacterium]
MNQQYDSSDSIDDANAVAIIGLSGRFPDANDLDQFWRNLRDGVDSVHPISDEELAAAGQEVLVVADHDLAHAVGGHDVRVAGDVFEQVGTARAAGVHADRAGIVARVVTGMLDRFPRALQEQALLRVHELGLACRHAEELGVEHLEAGQHRGGLDIVLVGDHRAVDAGRGQLLVADRVDRIDTVAQVAPELVEIVCVGEA